MGAQMKNWRSSLVASAFAASMGLAAAPANAIEILGVTINPMPSGAVFGVTSIFETQVTAPGQVLSGYGAVTQINGVAIGGLCAGCELTFRLNNYTVASISATNVTFTGGTVDLFVDFTPDFNPFISLNQGVDIATATDGALFLSLAGHTGQLTVGGFTGTGTLVGAGTVIGASVNATGVGLLDVTGGAAAANFDTTSFADALGGFADITFASSFASQTLLPQIPLSGSASFQAQVISEPASLALMGLGLLLAGFVGRRRVAAG